MTGVADDVELLRSMVEIPSESGREGELAAFLAERIAGCGLTATIDGVGNVIGSTPPTDGPVIMLLGHLDTVPGWIPPVLDGGVLHGRGAVDAKGPLATMVRAAVRVSARIAAQVIVVGAVDEERGSVGARHLMDGPAPDAVVIGEPSGVDCVGLGYKGVLRLRLALTRSAAHTSSPDGTAAEAAAALWVTLRARLADRYAADVALFDRVMPSLVGIDGDLHRAVLDLSLRLPTGADTGALVAELAALDPSGELTVVEHVPAIRSTRSDPVVRALTAAIRDRGARPVHKLKLGTSDMNLVMPHWNVPAAAYGPGDSRLCHTAAERIDLDDYLHAIDVLSAALPALAAALPDGRARR